MKILFVQTGGTIDKDYPHTTKGWPLNLVGLLRFEFLKNSIHLLSLKFKLNFRKIVWKSAMLIVSN